MNGPLSKIACTLAAVAALGCDLEEPAPGSIAVDEAADELGVADDLEAARAAWDAGNIVEVEPEVLAHFSLPGGREVIFEGLPATGDVSIGETYPDGEAGLLDPDATILDEYLRLAPPETPVPAMLVRHELGEDSLEDTLDGRPIVDGEAVFGELELTDKPRFTKAAAFCNSGGREYFEDKYCPSDDGYRNFCDPGQWWVLQRNSPARLYTSRATTGACESGAWVSHAWWNGFNWVKIYSYEVSANYVKTRTWYGSGVFYRSVRHDRMGSGYIRAWTHFG